MHCSLASKGSNAAVVPIVEECVSQADGALSFELPLPNPEKVRFTMMLSVPVRMTT